MDKRLAQELIKTRKAVKKKFESLKVDSIESDLKINKKFKPIAQPLKELLSSFKAENRQIKLERPEIKQSPNTSFALFDTPKISRKSIDNSKTARALFTTPSTAKTSSQEERNDDEQVDFQETEVVAESDPVPTLEDLRSELSLLGESPAFEEYLNQYEGLAKYYVESMFRDTEKSFDHTYGVRFTPELETFEIGNSKLDFIGQNIRITLPNDQQFDYIGTPGLYELLFKKNPEGQTKEDSKNYRDILQRTNAARRHYKSDEQILGTGRKYSNTVKHLLFPKPSKAVKSKIATKTSLKGGGGLQMLKLNNKKREFIPWRDPNKLVDWLRILMSSKSAGHTGHTNEIIYIIDELRRAKIIK